MNPKVVNGQATERKQTKAERYASEALQHKKNGEDFWEKRFSAEVLTRAEKTLNRMIKSSGVTISNKDKKELVENITVRNAAIQSSSAMRKAAKKYRYAFAQKMIFGGEIDKELIKMAIEAEKIDRERHAIALKKEEILQKNKISHREDSSYMIKQAELKATECERNLCVLGQAKTPGQIIDIAFGKEGMSQEMLSDLGREVLRG